MNRSKLFLMVGVFLVAAFAAVVVHVDAAENDATISLTWDVGDVVDGTISNNVSAFVDPNVPGVTFQLISPPGILGATGSPTTAGSYLGSITNATTGVVEPLSITVRQDAETFTVTFMSGYGGTVSRDSISDVPKDSSITVSSNRVTINGTTVTATANSGYHFSYWYNASGTITANRTITAYFEADAPTEYTCYLRYNANGGTGAPSTQSYTGTSTSSHTFTISSIEPTRSGYTFAGWATNSSATSASYQPGDTISVGYNASRTLYAVWTANQYTCYLYYDANGGTGAPSTQSYTGTSTSSHTFTISTTVPTRDGYTFLGWHTSASATEAAYHGGDSISVRYNSYVNLYAIWQANSYTCYLYYDANGGTGAPSTQSYTGTSTSSHTFTISSTVPTRDGYTFLGWSILSTATEPTYLPGESIDVGYQSTVTLFAIWKQILTLNIDLTYLNGHAVVKYNGTVVATTSTFQMDYGDSYTLSITDFATGYHFRYWSFYEPRGQGAYTDSNQTYTGTLTTDTYVSPEFNYEVTIRVNNSLMGSVDRSSLIVHDSTISTSDNILTVGSNTVTATANTGYIFGSWTIPGSVTTVTEPITITANFGDNLFSLNIDLTYLDGHAVVSFNDIVVTATSTFQLNYGSSYTLSITDFATGYHFRYWSFYEPRGQGAYTDSNQTYTGTLTTDTYVSPEFNYEVTIRVNNSLMGSVDRSSLIVHDSTIRTSGNVLTIGSNTTTATANTGYEFESWTIPGSVTTVTEPITITANFGRIPTDVTWWSNDQYNGKVDILFKFGDSDNKIHTLNMDLYSPTVSEGITTWTPSGFSLTVSVSYPSAQITASLSGGTELSKTVNPGKWSTFIVSIDSDNGTVSVTPIKTFQSFTDHTVYEKQTKTVLDFSAQIDGAAVYTIGHTESDSGENSPRFQVVSTNVFLNTYGVVLYNPTINLFDYWPQYESLRVNFYSFALYGESITINGTTYQVKDGKITVQYVSNGDEHFLPGIMPNAKVQTRTFNLDNIYVTYQDNHAYLTFVPERFTLDLGSYTTGSETISMSGLWYFASMVYEPYTVMEKHLSDWKTFPETSSAQMLLIFIAILIVAGAFVALHIRKSGLGWIDLAIIGCAAVVAFIMLG